MAGCANDRVPHGLADHVAFAPGLPVRLPEPSDVPLPRLVVEAGSDCREHEAARDGYLRRRVGDHRDRERRESRKGQRPREIRIDFADKLIYNDSQSHFDCVLSYRELGSRTVDWVISISRLCQRGGFWLLHLLCMVPMILPTATPEDNSLVLTCLANTWRLRRTRAHSRYI